MAVRIPWQVRIHKHYERGGPDDCWLWTGYRCHQGYGRINRKDGSTLAYRALYELEVGPVPDGLVLDHRCDTPACVNPGHLRPVTNRENVLRGKGATARHARKTHCHRGHEYTPENTATPLRGDAPRRYCRTCRRMMDEAKRERKRSLVTSAT